MGAVAAEGMSQVARSARVQPSWARLPRATERHPQAFCTEGFDSKESVNLTYRIEDR